MEQGLPGSTQRIEYYRWCVENDLPVFWQIKPQPAAYVTHEERSARIAAYRKWRFNRRQKVDDLNRKRHQEMIKLLNSGVDTIRDLSARLGISYDAVRRRLRNVDGVSVRLGVVSLDRKRSA